MTISQKILHFYKRLSLDIPLPHGIITMNPYQNKKTFTYVEKFYHQYYHDQQPRDLIVGINPGRFGGGVTGIPFTDPIKLEDICGIPNSLTKRKELSADFIYQMIAAYGGPQIFYKRFFISAVSPLGFTRNGKNLNYYDDLELQNALSPFIVSTLKQQLQFGLNPEVCFCLGEGKNHAYLERLNRKESFFKKIIPLAHPRFIMQYKRKKINDFIDDYLKKFTDIA